MEAAVLIGHEARRGQQDAFQGPALHRRGNLVDGALVNVQVRCGAVFHQGGLVLHHHGHLPFREHQVQGAGQGRMDFQVEVLRHHALGSGLQVVLAVGGVVEGEAATRIGLHGLLVAADLVLQPQRSTLDGLILVVLHSPGKGPSGGENRNRKGRIRGQRCTEKQ